MPNLEWERALNGRIDGVSLVPRAAGFN